MTKENLFSQLSGSIYVHNSPTRQYIEAKNTILNKYKTENLSNFLVKKVLNKEKVSAKEKEVFFDFYGGLGNPGILQKKLEANIKNIDIRTALETTPNYDNIHDAIQKIKNDGDIQAIKELNDWLKEIINLGEGAQLYNIAESIVQQDIINNKVFNENNLSMSDWYSKIKNEIYAELGNAGIVKMKTSSKELQRQSDFIRLIYLFSQFLDNKIQNSNSSPINEQESKILSKYAEYIVGRMSSFIGILYQPLVTAMIDEGTDDIIEEIIEAGSNMVKIKNPFFNTKKGSLQTQTVSTQDIKIILKNQDKLKKVLSINIDLPDIGGSLKYGGGLRSKYKSSVIKIKDPQTNLGVLLHDLDNKHLSYIYNIIANYKRNHIKISSKRIANPITFEEYSEMWQYLKMIVLINGMIGQMTKEDFSYYFIVSGRVYTVVDIINSLLTENPLIQNNKITQFNIEMAKVPMLNPSQSTIAKNHKFETNELTPWDNAFLRSKKVVEAIQNTKIQAGIRMRIRELN